VLFMAVPLHGAPVKHDANDASHLERVWRGVKELNEGKNDAGNHIIPIKVVSAQSLLVAGTKWEYEVLVGESDCTDSQLSK
ncbi:hypothetical protein PENTCL1PPCAC_8004, partial [Pristionchus entomophagus]